MPVFPLKLVPAASYQGGHRYFGAARTKGRKHGGCDLLAPTGTEIVAIDDGTVIQGPYYFYEGTYALEVEHPGFVVRYGEISAAAKGVKAKAKVVKGQVIAYVGGLKMLHFELYTGTEVGPLTQRKNKPYERRGDVVDPAPYLASWPLPT
jgi:murein DD-endopeptidase MepM/ murein hydrolase activator NlpD